MEANKTFRQILLQFNSADGGDTFYLEDIEKAVEIFHAQFSDIMPYEKGELTQEKLQFYRDQTDKIRKYLNENKIGKPTQGFFDAILDHLKCNTVKRNEQESCQTCGSFFIGYNSDNTKYRCGYCGNYGESKINSI